VRKIITLASWLKMRERVKQVALTLTFLIYLLAAISIYLRNVFLGLFLIMVTLFATVILDWQWNVRLSRPKGKPSPKIWLLGILIAIFLGGLIGLLPLWN